MHIATLMPSRFVYIYRYSYLIILLVLSSCEYIFDKNPTYVYKVKNNTTMTIEVRLTSPVIANNATSTTKIEAGKTGGVWTITDYDDDSWVYNREKYRKEFIEFDIESLSKEGLLMKSNPNDTKRWDYEKVNNNKATYTLTVEETDF